MAEINPEIPADRKQQIGTFIKIIKEMLDNTGTPICLASKAPKFETLIVTKQTAYIYPNKKNQWLYAIVYPDGKKIIGEFQNTTTFDSINTLISNKITDTDVYHLSARELDSLKSILPWERKYHQHIQNGTVKTGLELIQQIIIYAFKREPKEKIAINNTPELAYFLYNFTKHYSIIADKVLKILDLKRLFELIDEFCKLEPKDTFGRSTSNVFAALITLMVTRSYKEILWEKSAEFRTIIADLKMKITVDSYKKPTGYKHLPDDLGEKFRIFLTDITKEIPDDLKYILKKIDDEDVRLQFCVNRFISGPLTQMAAEKSCAKDNLKIWFAHVLAPAIKCLVSSSDKRADYTISIPKPILDLVFSEQYQLWFKKNILKFSSPFTTSKIITSTVWRYLPSLLEKIIETHNKYANRNDLPPLSHFIEKICVLYEIEERINLLKDDYRGAIVATSPRAEKETPKTQKSDKINAKIKIVKYKNLMLEVIHTKQMEEETTLNYTERLHVQIIKIANAFEQLITQLGTQSRNKHLQKLSTSLNKSPRIKHGIAYQNKTELEASFAAWQEKLNTLHKLYSKAKEELDKLDQTIATPTLST